MTLSSMLSYTTRDPDAWIHKFVASQFPQSVFFKLK